jgi:hypothetical protein
MIELQTMTLQLNLSGDKTSKVKLNIFRQVQITPLKWNQSAKELRKSQHYKIVWYEKNNQQLLSCPRIL